MRCPARVFVAFLVLGLALAGLPAVEAAGKYPEKLITYVVPFSAGGGTDRWARILSSVAIDHFGQPWHVVNKPGASGIVGWKWVLSRPADGYTILQGSTTNVLPLLMEAKPPLRPEQIKIVAYISTFSSILLSKPGAPWSTWAGLKEYAQKNPGKLTLGSSMSLTLGIAHLFEQAGIKATYVPYKDTATGVADFLGGHISMAPVTVSTGKTLIPSKAVPVVNSSDIPIPDKEFKGVPMAKDLGYKGVDFPRWVGVHPDTPDEVADFISERLGRLLKDKVVLDLMKKIGEDIVFVPRAQAQKQYVETVESMKRLVKLLKK